MANGSYGKCAGCGEMVIWVKTQAEKNISIAHVHCGAFEVGAGIPFPFPFPPGFLK